MEKSLGRFLPGSGIKRMERIFPLLISEIVLLFMVRYGKTQFIGCWQIICELLYFRFFLPRNNISLQFIAVIRHFKVEREKHSFKVDTFALPSDQ